MMVTFDEQFLLTVSEDGCLLMWKLLDKDGRGLKVTRQMVHAEEILVTKADLEETVRTGSQHCLVSTKETLLDDLIRALSLKGFSTSKKVHLHLLWI